MLFRTPVALTSCMGLFPTPFSLAPLEPVSMTCVFVIWAAGCGGHPYAKSVARGVAHVVWDLLSLAAGLDERPRIYWRFVHSQVAVYSAACVSMRVVCLLWCIVRSRTELESLASFEAISYGMVHIWETFLIDRISSIISRGGIRGTRAA